MIHKIPTNTENINCEVMTLKMLTSRIADNLKNDLEI